jgi:hypothetical protein
LIKHRFSHFATDFNLNFKDEVKENARFLESQKQTAQRKVSQKKN